MRVARQAHEKRLIGDPELAGRFVAMAGYRNRLTHYYDEVTPDEFFDILRDRLPDLEAVADALARSAAELARDG